MDDRDKIAVIKLLLGQLVDSEVSLLKRRIENESELRDLFENYRDIVQKIDVFYALKSIELKVNSMDSLSDVKKIKSGSPQRNNTNNMGSTTTRMSLLIVITIAIAAVVTWGFNMFLNWEKDNANKAYIEKQNQVQLLKEDSIKIALENEKERINLRGTDFTGIAIARSGSYLVPYEWVQNGTILATSEIASNKIPATILWDDEMAGLAVLKFAVENQKKLKAFPYMFSNKKFFLGEEIMIIGSTGENITYNFGRVIDDDENSNVFRIKVELENPILGAPVIDKNGLIIGLVESMDPDGIGTVQKSISIFTMISEMNLDKGIERIIMPKKNSLYKLSNPDRIIAIEPFLVHFNVRKNK